MTCEDGVDILNLAVWTMKETEKRCWMDGVTISGMCIESSKGIKVFGIRLLLVDDEKCVTRRWFGQGSNERAKAQRGC